MQMRCTSVLQRDVPRDQVQAVQARLEIVSFPRWSSLSWTWERHSVSNQLWLKKQLFLFMLAKLITKKNEKPSHWRSRSHKPSDTDPWSYPWADWITRSRSPGRCSRAGRSSSPHEWISWLKRSPTGPRHCRNCYIWEKKVHSKSHTN